MRGANSHHIQDFMCLLRMRGVQGKEIANRMKISYKTYSYHWARLCRRVGSNDLPLICWWAVRRGLVVLTVGEVNGVAQLHDVSRH